MVGCGAVLFNSLCLLTPTIGCTLVVFCTGISFFFFWQQQQMMNTQSSTMTMMTMMMMSHENPSRYVSLSSSSSMRSGVAGSVAFTAHSGSSVSGSPISVALKSPVMTSANASSPLRLAPHLLPHQLRRLHDH